MTLKLGVFFTLFVCVCAAGAAGLEIFPLSEVRPGLRGETWTVLSGREVVRLETEIIGIAEDRLAPGKHLIIGRLVDERVAVSGPVHGMSGSPLFVEGRLVGALSRRLGLFEKDAQCGFTPVEDMLELWEEGADATAGGSSVGRRTGVPGSGEMGQLFSGGQFDGVGVSGEWLLLPVASGLREGWWLDFGRQLWQGTGLFLQAGGGGPGVVGSDAPGAPLEPGAPVAAALAVGDMVLAGTGTLTWREGDRILAFGHPMLDLGAVRLPMCEAEVVTIVPSYMMPYKLANTRREVGTVVLDRLSAISGVVGERAELPTYDVAVIFSGRETRWRGRFFGHRRLASVLMATLALRALSAREDLPGEVFFQHRGRAVFLTAPGEGTQKEYVLRLDGAGSGDSAAWIGALTRMLTRLEAVLGQNFSEVIPASFEWSVDVLAGERMLSVSRVEISPTRLAAGAEALIRVTLDDRRGGSAKHEVKMRVPNDLGVGEFLTVRVLSGMSLDMERAGLSEVNFGGITITAMRRQDRRETQPRSVEEVFAQQNRIGGANELAIVVTRSGQAVRQGIEVIEGLPGSVAALLKSDSRVEVLQESVVFETRLNVGAVVAGELSQQVQVFEHGGWF